MLLSHYSPEPWEAGCDEAGRGCLAGPVFAAAVILPPDYINPLLNDSKQLTHRQRERLRHVIETDAIAWSVNSIDAPGIDDMNILNASILAMNQAVGQLTPQPGFLLIDGNRFHTSSGIPYACIIRGDSRYLSIAAASILAKTFRDAHMESLHHLFPAYNWKKNKGYPTQEHREAIARYGITPFHRKSFRCEPQLKLEF